MKFDGIKCPEGQFVPFEIDYVNMDASDYSIDIYKFIY